MSEHIIIPFSNFNYFVKYQLYISQKEEEGVRMLNEREQFEYAEIYQKYCDDILTWVLLAKSAADELH